MERNTENIWEDFMLWITCLAGVIILPFGILWELGKKLYKYNKKRNE